MDGILWPLAILGHIGIWCFFFNRTHATAWPRSWRKAIEKAVLVLVFVPLGLALWFLVARGFPPIASWAAGHPGWLAYFSFCATAGTWFLAAWIVRRWRSGSPLEIRHTRRERVDMEAIAGRPLTAGAFAQTLRWIPGNQCCEMEFGWGTIHLSEKFGGLAGLRIAHLSDFHLTGGIQREYFERLVDWVNQQSCDLVLITGDLLDSPKCLDWIPPVFGKLQARLGKYFVFGNHDLLIPDQNDYRDRLRQAGLVYATGHWLTLEIAGTQVHLTGNDSPWYRGAESLPVDSPGEGLRILLAHSPDPIGWAGRQGIDLMFAGHNHGGQICFPGIGPVISPSRFGVRFASGEFKVGPTLMLVSRGISGDEPIRWFCPPQITVWTLEPRVPG